MDLTTAAEVVFWTCAFLLAYTYTGYPLLLAVASRLRSRPVRRADRVPACGWPTVSVIITAYNEEQALAAKLENTLVLDFPKEKLEIIVASDCSTDRTDAIAGEFAPLGVRLHRQPQRLGKTAAQNTAVELARGEILLFSDATTLYRPYVLRAMMPNFADPTVGCVAGQLLYVDLAHSSVGRGARSYWSYERFLKQCESRLGSLIGVSGCLYAVRRSAYVPLYHEACSDFIIATKMVELGLRAVYEPGAVCIEETNDRSDRELAMRVRIITQTLTDLWRHRAMMNPWRSGFYAVQLVSHKVLRYLVPFFLGGSLVASPILAPHSTFYAAAWLAQVGLYGAAAVAWALEGGGGGAQLGAGPRGRSGAGRRGARLSLLALPQYFVLANAACLIALYKCLRGERYARWEPIREPAAHPEGGGAQRGAGPRGPAAATVLAGRKSGESVARPS